jgi:hypothetical protein
MKAEEILTIFVPLAAANHICYEKLFADRRHITLFESPLDD